MTELTEEECARTRKLINKMGPTNQRNWDDHAVLALLDTIDALRARIEELEAMTGPAIARLAEMHAERCRERDEALAQLAEALAIIERNHWSGKAHKP